MRSAIIKKSSLEEQQKQTTIATNSNYIHNFNSIFLIKKLIRKVKIASDKTETKQNKLYFIRKYMGPLHNEAC